MKISQLMPIYREVRLTVKTDKVHSAVLTCLNAILEHKARNLVLLNVQNLSSIADYFILCSGASDRQVQAIAAFVQETLKKKSGLLPLGVEGESVAQWVLIDYGDFILHIFYEPIREFYGLERLWADAPRMEIGDDVLKVKALAPEM